MSERSILLVEDNAGDVRLTREALREAEVAVELIAVSDGEQALAFLRREGAHAGAARPDLILLDLNLPKKNGLEVLEEIKGDPELRRTPVIMLTTSSSARDIAACYDRGVNCYVVKPLDLDDFTGLVQAINRFWFEVARLPPALTPGALASYTPGHGRRRDAPPVRLHGGGHDPEVAEVRRGRGPARRGARRDRDRQGQHDLRGRPGRRAQDRGPGGRHAAGRRHDRADRRAAAATSAARRTRRSEDEAAGRRAESGGAEESVDAPEDEVERVKQPEPVATEEAPEPEPRRRDEGNGRVKASPIARRMAQELGVELSGLSGTGPGGRIVKADVEAAAGNGKQAEERARRGRAAGGGSAPKPERRPEPVVSGDAGTGRGETTIEDLTRLQQTIARRMAESKATAPEFVLTVEVDMEEAVAFRKQLKAAAGEDPAPSFNDFVVKASALALKEFPRANGAYRDGKFELYSRVNVGIAVAGAGRADRADDLRRRRQVARADLARRARARRARARGADHAARALLGHVQRLQPRHVRDQALHRRASTRRRPRSSPSAR